MTLISLIHNVAMSLKIGIVLCIINKTGCVVDSFTSTFIGASSSFFTLVLSEENNVEIIFKRKFVRTLFASLNYEWIFVTRKTIGIEGMNSEFLNIEDVLKNLRFGFVREIVIRKNKAIQRYPTILVHLQVRACS